LTLQHPEPDLPEPVDDPAAAEPEPRDRRVHDAWEAVVREELLRLRRRFARDRRFARRRTTSAE
jgi:hypothetical protein